MKRIFLFISLSALAFFQCNGLSAQRSFSESGLFIQANEQYANGNYAEAVSLYQQCLTAQRSDSVGGLTAKRSYSEAVIYYNLGNALFKQGELSHAILAYERSLRLNPRDKDCKHNLAFAQAQIIDNVEDNEFFLSSWAKTLRNQLPIGTWFILSIIFWVLTLGAILALLLSTLNSKLSTLHSFFHLSWICLLLAIVMGLNAYSLHRRDTLRSEAIITQGIVNVKASPDRSGTELFTLHEGTKVTIHETLGEWVEIHVGNNIGWLPANYLERI